MLRNKATGKISLKVFVNLGLRPLSKENEN